MTTSLIVPIGNSQIHLYLSLTYAFLTMPNHDHPAAKFGPSSHVIYHGKECEPERANSLSELFRPWIIRQVSSPTVPTLLRLESSYR